MAAIDKSLYEKFEIENLSKTKTVDIKAGVISFNYYEDLFSPMITARIVVVNTGNTIEGEDGKIQSVYNGLPLRGGEKIQIKIAGNSRDNQGLELKELYIGSITDVQIDSEREMFVLNLISREALTNETIRVGKRFPSSQKISDSVKDICTNYLSSDKLYDVDETQNPYGFIGNMRKPFTVLTMLASKSVPGNASGKDATAEKPVSVDIGPMVPGRKRSKPIKNDPEEKSAFLFPRWETKYVDSIDVLGSFCYI